MKPLSRKVSGEAPAGFISSRKIVRGLGKATRDSLVRVVSVSWPSFGSSALWAHYADLPTSG